MSNKDYIENVDYYLEEGRVYFTEKYLKERKKCCGMEHCRHCPYTNKIKDNTKLKK
jgi:hypothetical protein